MFEKHVTEKHYRFVASLVTMDVVDALEIVKVEVEEGGVPAVVIEPADPPRYFVLEECAPVQQAGQPVGAREFEDTLVIVDLLVGDAKLTGDIGQQSAVVIAPRRSARIAPQKHGAVDLLAVVRGSSEHGPAADVELHRTGVAVKPADAIVHSFIVDGDAVGRGDRECRFADTAENAGPAGAERARCRLVGGGRTGGGGNKPGDHQRQETHGNKPSPGFARRAGVCVGARPRARLLAEGIAMEMGVSVAAVAAVAVAVVAVIIAVVLGTRGRAESAAQMARFGDVAEQLAGRQAELTGRLEQTQTGVNERLDSLAKRLGDGLAQQTEKTGETLRVLHERLAVIDAAQKNITELSTQMVGLQDILSNKQARGAFGEVQLQDLVTSVLPPSAYMFQATLGNRNRADCLLKLPNPPGAIVIDAKFPLESYAALRDADDDAARVQVARAFSADVLNHVRSTAEKYVIPGETAESALMFLPSEAVYAELHANFRNVIEESYRRRVWIVSPTTLWATLNTVRAVLKDARMREQAGVIQVEVRSMAEDVGRLDDRVGKLQRHFDQATEDVRQIRISTEKIARRADRIDDIEFGDDSAGDLPAAPADRIAANETEPS